MATKKIEEYSVAELRKFFRLMKTILIIELIFVSLFILFIGYSKFMGGFNLSPFMYIFPLTFVAVMVGPFVSMNNFKKELEKRGETV